MNRSQHKTSAVFLSLISLAGMALSAEKKPVEYVLPNGWAISPVGTQIELDGLPLKLVSVPGGPYVLATSNGYTEHFLAVIDVSTARVVQHLPIAEAGWGWPSQPTAAGIASAGSRDRILVFDFTAGRLAPAGDISLDIGTFPAGLCLNQAGNRLYVTANTADAILVVDLNSRRIKARVPVGIKPYTCLVTSDEKTAYVSNWGEASVAVVDLEAGRMTAEIKVQDRPNDLALTADQQHLFVSCGNWNTVSVMPDAHAASDRAN